MADAVADEEYFFRLGEAFLLPPRHIYGQDEGAIYNACLPAFTICEVFAAEAYLKALIKIETGADAPRIHNLTKLFARLLPATQAAIRNEWIDKHAATVLDIDHGNAPGGKPFETPAPKTFEEALALSAEAFIRWRYNFHEHHGWFMRALGYLVRRQILTVRPDWRPEAGSYFSRLDANADFVKPKPEERSAFTGGTKINYRSPTFRL